MDEMTTDALEASFDAIERAELPPVRPMLAGGRPLGSAAFEGFLRSGSGGFEMKALSGASDAAGGYAVPEEIDSRIDATLKAVSPIRSIATTVTPPPHRRRMARGRGPWKTICRGRPSGWLARRTDRGTSGRHDG